MHSNVSMYQQLQMLKSYEIYAGSRCNNYVTFNFPNCIVRLMDDIAYLESIMYSNIFYIGSFWSPGNSSRCKWTRV